MFRISYSNNQEANKQTNSRIKYLKVMPRGFNARCPSSRKRNGPYVRGEIWMPCFFFHVYMYCFCTTAKNIREWHISYAIYKKVTHGLPVTHPHTLKSRYARFASISRILSRFFLSIPHFFFSNHAFCHLCNLTICLPP